MKLSAGRVAVLHRDGEGTAVPFTVAENADVEISEKGFPFRR